MNVSIRDPGPISNKEVRAFQKLRGLKVDGKAGNQTFGFVVDNMVMPGAGEGEKYTFLAPIVIAIGISALLVAWLG